MGHITSLYGYIDADEHCAVEHTVRVLAECMLASYAAARSIVSRVVDLRIEDCQSSRVQQGRYTCPGEEHEERHAR